MMVLVMYDRVCTKCAIVCQSYTQIPLYVRISNWGDMYIRMYRVYYITVY